MTCNTHEKMFNIINHQGSTNKIKTQSHLTLDDGYYQKVNITSVGVGVEEGTLCTVGGM